MAHRKFCDLAGKPGALVYEPGSIYGCTCIVLPQDAGEYAEGLKLILERFSESIYPGFQCGPGWYKLLIEVDEKLNYLCPEYEIQQIKEKFGTLRFYWGMPYKGDYKAGLSDTDREMIFTIMSDVVHYAENSSSIFCEICGNYGRTLTKNYWLKTLCKTCATEKGFDYEQLESD